MLRLLSSVAITAAATAFAACGALAADYLSPAPASQWRLADEFRIGGFAHSVDGGAEQDTVDVNIELLSSRLYGSTEWYVPRLHVGASINTGGDTSHVYGGVTWTVDLGTHFFIEASFGGGVHDGYTGPSPAPAGERSLGCSPLFRESASVGVRITEQISLMATIEHLSNANLCNANRGLTNAGVRLGYSF